MTEKHNIKLTTQSISKQEIKYSKKWNSFWTSCLWSSCLVCPGVEKWQWYIENPSGGCHQSGSKGQNQLRAEDTGSTGECANNCVLSEGS